MVRPFFIYEITPRCNNDCIYCYNVWKDASDYPAGELTVHESKELFEKVLSEVEPSGITITGGEPLLHEGLLEIVSYLNGKNVRLGIATNGSLLDDGKVGSLVDNGVSYFEVSLVSANRDSYAEMSRNDCIDSVRSAMLSIKKRKAALNISVVVTNRNKKEIGDIIDLAFAFSADSVSLNRFVPGGCGLRNLSDCLISDSDLAKVLSAADKKAGELNFPVNITVPVEHCMISHGGYPHLNFGTCVCGEGKWVIDPKGNLRTCEQNPGILGNLFEKDFSELAGSEAAISFRGERLSKDCGICARKDDCGGGCRILHASRAGKPVHRET
jgi:radical SAM protein with 4Fe4S-binding SPASM domain